jgi:predicted CxxxxCH...CXXCH cytochrome family protein
VPCEVCHYRAIADGKPLAGQHVNGTVEVGDAQGTCSGCHGDATSPAPPRPLTGSADRSNPAVGAHREHLQASRLRGPIACNECHQVPATVDAPGHIDSDLPAEVFPNVAGVGVLARANGAQAEYDGLSTTCTTYCHGTATPSWTGGQEQAQCGSCHALPPNNSSHSPDMQLTQCTMCHGPTINKKGELKFTTNPTTGAIESTHMDGQVSFGIGLE